jgi:hypothetical protein
MLEARAYERGHDAQGLDVLLEENKHGDVRLDLDRIICLGDVGRPVGCLVWRPGGIVHELRLRHGLGRRAAADALVDFSIRDALSRPFWLAEAVFMTDSPYAAEYFERLGAERQPGQEVFKFDLRRYQNERYAST